MLDHEYLHMYRAEERLWWFRAMHLFLQRFLPRPQGAQSALDIGCGTGGLMQHLAELGYHSIGLDYSLVGLRFAQQRPHNTLLQASANEIPFNGSFDLVTCVDLLEVETVDPQRLVDSALRSLKPGGTALFVMAAHQWLLSEHDRAVNSVRRYNLVQLKGLFANKEVEILRASYLFSFTFPVVALRKLINPAKRNQVRPAVSDVSVPPAVINLPLLFVCWLESLLLPRVSLPIGSSVLIMVRKNG
jgi:SAM-dependent methyltransferase